MTDATRAGGDQTPPGFSVIIPTQGRRLDYLRQAVDSVVHQSHTPTEVILVLDGPDPSTRAEFDDPLIRFVERTSEGVAAARNDGIAAAGGDWVCFIDDDDLWHPEFLSSTVEYLSKNPHAAAIHAPQWTFGISAATGAELVANSLKECIAAAQSAVQLRDTSWTNITGRSYDLLLERNRGCISASAVRRDIIQRAGGFPVGYSCAEDWIMFVNVARYTEWHTLGQRLGFYRLHESNNTKTDALINGLITLRAIGAVWQESARPTPAHRPLAEYGIEYRFVAQQSIWNALRRRRLDIAVQSYRAAHPLLPRRRDRMFALLPPPVTWRWYSCFGDDPLTTAHNADIVRAGLRINAYILAADPAFIESSVRSYYPLVGSIVVSYDEDGLGWTGYPMPIETCLRRLRDIDIDNKLIFLPGKYHSTDLEPFQMETRQRQQALNAAGKDADWVLQLDTDEVITDPELFLDCLLNASRGDYQALNYPLRRIYRHIRGAQYLEFSDRFWRRTTSYPGPVAVEAGTQLRLARQTDTRVFHVDFPRRAWSEAYGGLPVNRNIRKRSALLHFSWVRSEEEMDAKAKTSGHSTEAAMHADVLRWKRLGRHPWLAVITTPLRRSSKTEQLRLTWVRTSGRSDHES